MVRPRFSFKISESSVLAIVGRETVLEETLNNEHPLVKASTRCSVLNIYDTYGLDITYTFLKYIYENKFYLRHEEWLVVYLQGSYFHMTGDILGMATEMHYLEAVPVLITHILLELLARERAEFKLAYELESVPSSHLPSDLVSRIVGSSRVSKGVTESIRTLRCNTIPTLEEVTGWSDSSGTYLLKDGSFYSFDRRTDGEGVDHTAAVLLTRTVTRRSDIFEIEVEVADETGRLMAHLEGGEPVVCESLQSYVNFFKNRRCNVNGSMLLLLSDLRARLLPITNQNVREACAWIVQLNMDLGMSILKQGNYQFTMKELSDELNALISEHQQRYR